MFGIKVLNIMSFSSSEPFNWFLQHLAKILKILDLRGSAGWSLRLPFQPHLIVLICSHLRTFCAFGFLCLDCSFLRYLHDLLRCRLKCYLSKRPFKTLYKVTISSFSPKFLLYAAVFWGRARE